MLSTRQAGTCHQDVIDRLLQRCSGDLSCLGRGPRPPIPPVKLLTPFMRSRAQLATGSYGWRANSLKVVVWFGDAPGKRAKVFNV